MYRRTSAVAESRVVPAFSTRKSIPCSGVNPPHWRRTSRTTRQARQARIARSARGWPGDGDEPLLDAEVPRLEGVLQRLAGELGRGGVVLPDLIEGLLPGEAGEGVRREGLQRRRRVLEQIEPVGLQRLGALLHGVLRPQQGDEALAPAGRGELLLVAPGVLLRVLVAGLRHGLHAAGGVLGGLAGRLPLRGVEDGDLGPGAAQ